MCEALQVNVIFQFYLFLVSMEGSRGALQLQTIWIKSVINMEAVRNSIRVKGAGEP